MSRSSSPSPGCAALRNCVASRVLTSSAGARTSRSASAPYSIRRKLSALSALFDDLCEHNAVVNPVDGVKRPIANGNEGTAALGDSGPQAARRSARGHAQGRARSRHPRDPALSRHAPRGIVPAARDIQSRQARPHFRVKGKRDKIPFVPVHVTAQRGRETFCLSATPAAGADIRPSTSVSWCLRLYGITVEVPLHPPAELSL